MSTPKRAKSDEVQGSVARWTTFMGMYLGYTLSIINRKSFTFALPAIMKDLDLDKNEVGLISSSQNLAYTFSKFVGGIMCDSVNVKYLFALSLFSSGLLTVSLSAFRTAAAFAIILALQGLAQGGGWPSCAKILKGMFTSTEFGTKYGLLNTAMNVAGCLGPVLVAFILANHSWSAVFVFTGIAAILGSLLSFIMIEWPVPKEFDNDKTSPRQMQGRGTWRDLMKSPLMWLICISYFVVFMGRTAALEWGQLYLIQDLKHSQHVGSLFISSMEVGGVIGSLASGYLADLLVSRAKDSLMGSPRLKVSMFFVSIFMSSLHCFLFHVSSATSDMFIMIIGFFMGFGIYGPISVYGVMSIEASPVHLQGTSHAIVSLAANFGAVTAGLPFSMVAQKLDWRGAFILLEAMLALVVILKIIMGDVTYKTVATRKKLQ